MPVVTAMAKSPTTTAAAALTATVVAKVAERILLDRGGGDNNPRTAVPASFQPTRWEWWHPPMSPTLTSETYMNVLLAVYGSTKIY